jgi:hypothetical protein
MLRKETPRKLLYTHGSAQGSSPSCSFRERVPHGDEDEPLSEDASRHRQDAPDPEAPYQANSNNQDEVTDKWGDREDDQEEDGNRPRAREFEDRFFVRFDEGDDGVLIEGEDNRGDNKPDEEDPPC